ncbi:MATE family efflux transporter [Sphingobium nicotianae]|uniref:MATE family efflux transporter n=1 Tax=Sphingobium nicotianae TaxID=2782607 RepID=A0A9X1IPQ8_9SPHN|nr:MATE family efflux transporter [Sphingobium nicotianae]MBT2186015.1 MATE family efflux transporter [Sphingobium nicotianae]
MSENQTSLHEEVPEGADITSEELAVAAAPRQFRGGRDLTTGPIFGTLVLFTLPTLISNILQSMNGSINSIWVSHFLGETALAGTANANIIMMLMFSLIFGFGMASNVVIGQSFGRGDLDTARRGFGSAIGFCLGLSILIAFAGYLWSDGILGTLSTPPEVFKLAKAYLHYTFFGLPGLMMFIVVMMGLRGGGDAMTPLWFMMLSVVLDVGLNPVFIGGFGPIHAMGIGGSAFASAIAGYVSLAAIVTYIYVRDLPLRLRGHEFAYLKPNWHLLRIIAGRGIPMGVQMVIMSLSTLVIIGFVNREGTITAAAYAASQQLWGYIQMPAMAVGGAVSSMAAQNIGANRWDRVERTTGMATLINVAMTGGLITLLLIFDRPILGLFLDRGGEAIEIGRHIIQIVSWSYLPFSIAMVMFGTMRANGIVLAPLIILTASLFFVRIGFYYVSYPLIGANGLWASFTVSTMVVLVLAWLYYRYGKWREVKIDMAMGPVEMPGH